MKLVIDRKIWLRGEGSANSRLLRQSDEKLCCVGIFGRAIDIPDDILKGQGSVRACSLSSRNQWPEWTTASPEQPNKSHDIYALYNWNDLMGVNEKEREEKIIELFAKHDVQVEFIN
jgi:hypothetical protein